MPILDDCAPRGPAHDRALAAGCAFVVAAASLAGFFAPALLRQRGGGHSQLTIVAAAATGTGVLLGVSLVHVLSDAEEALSSPCLPRDWLAAFPNWGTLICAATIMLMVVLEYVLQGMFERKFQPQGETACGAAAFAPRPASRDGLPLSAQCNASLAFLSPLPHGGDGGGGGGGGGGIAVVPGAAGVRRALGVQEPPLPAAAPRPTSRRNGGAAAAATLAAAADAGNFKSFGSGRVLELTPSSSGARGSGGSASASGSASGSAAGSSGGGGGSYGSRGSELSRQVAIELGLPDPGSRGTGSTAGGVSQISSRGLAEEAERALRLGAVIFVQASICTHSIPVGIALGLQGSESLYALLLAVSVHQALEGLSVGAATLEARCGARALAALGACFAATAPAGVALGVVLRTVLDMHDPRYLIVLGVMDAIASGMLLYVAIEHMNALGTKGPWLRRQHWAAQLVVVWCFLAGGACIILVGKYS